MDLRSVVGHLEAIAPSSRAENWDNVGVLVEPSGNPAVNSVLLTTDLTEEVMTEAEERGVGLVVSYHPPIFHPLKRLTQCTAQERTVVRALERRMAVYSPHTSLDSLEGGVTDWLVSGLGEGTMSALGLSLHSPQPPQLLIAHGLAQQAAAELASKMDLRSKPAESDPTLCDVEVACSQADAASLLLHLHQTAPSTALSLQPMPQVPRPTGGRVLCLTSPATLSELVGRVKAHLGLVHVRLAVPSTWTDDTTVTTIAACPGSGAGVLRGVEADVYLTGEMGHHEVLAARARGVAVILCEHSNTERGYLRSYQALLQGRLGPSVTVELSTVDADPLTVV